MVLFPSRSQAQLPRGRGWLSTEMRGRPCIGQVIDKMKSKYSNYNYQPRLAGLGWHIAIVSTRQQFFVGGFREESSRIVYTFDR